MNYFGRHAENHTGSRGLPRAESRACVRLGIILFVIATSGAPAAPWMWAGTTGTLDLGCGAIYGTQGVPGSLNRPGGRTGAVSWTDSTGSFWVFGGNGYDTAATQGWLNDLWKYDAVTNKWTWMKGSDVQDQPAVYGTLGVPSPSNTPGARTSGAGWTDGTGNLWLFGGETNFPRHNDLWKYDIAAGNWTWIGGSSSPNQAGNYGTQGVPSSTNMPGSRHGCATWKDGAGVFWLFGGAGYDGSGTLGYLNDVWRYDVTTGYWTWMKGSNAVNHAGSYGLKGTPDPTNNPGTRHSASCWIDASGMFWMYGGLGYDASGASGELSDLWRLDPVSNNWTWIAGSNMVAEAPVYGTQGVPASANTPGARFQAVAWREGAGTLCLFGGSAQLLMLNDLWKYDIASGMWTWVQGSSGPFQSGSYGQRGIATSSNIPGARQTATVAVTGTGRVWLFGGGGTDGFGAIGLLNDLWQYDPSNGFWAWMAGGDTVRAVALYGTQGVPSSLNRPGGRQQASSWSNDSDSFWVFGGRGHDDIAQYGKLNDLWRFDQASGDWTWLTGEKGVDKAGSYGTQGAPGAGNTPGSRAGAVSWAGLPSALWLFGGYGNDSAGAEGYLNDLWKYNPLIGQWTWAEGSSLVDQPGVYGIQGTSAPANTPGSRSGSVSWIDAGGNLWLFGGSGRDTSDSLGALNDLWRYDPASGDWTWKKGSSLVNQPGVYGTQGTTARSYTPGARYNAVSWRAGVNELWLFGGKGFDSAGHYGVMNDLWKYDISSGNWTWVKGSNVEGQDGVYGTQGVEAAANTPGAREMSTSWTDQSGRLWLFGGYGWALPGPPDTVGLNDMWVFNPATGNWTWMTGSDDMWQSGVGVIFGTQSPSKTPGARWGAVPWRDATGALLLFGGLGLDCGNYFTFLADVWRFSPPHVVMRQDESFLTDKTNPHPGGTTGWTPFGDSEDNPVLDYDASNDALRITIGTGNKVRVNGWMSANSEWLPYSSVGTDQYVRGKFHVFRTGQTNMLNLNQVPNMRLRLATRFAQNSMLEVFNHLSGDVAGTNAGRDLVMSDNPLLPSIYRVDFDPVDVPALELAGEGILRGFECYCLEPQENGSIELAEAWIGTYPAATLPDTGPDVLFEKTMTTTPTDAGELGVSDPLADGPFFLKFILTAPGILGAQVPLDGSTDPFYMDNTTGVTLDTSLVATDRVGMVVREFTELGDYTSRIRVEQQRQYKIRWHVLSNSNANTNPQLRLRSRTLKFMWSQKLEIGGALASGRTNNTIAQESLPGEGTMNPDQETPGENGGWYTLLMHTPMSPEIKPVQSYIYSLPGPGVDATSMRDIKLGIDILDTLSGSASSVAEAGWFTLIRIEMRAYDLVPD